MDVKLDVISSVSTRTSLHSGSSTLHYLRNLLLPFTARRRKPLSISPSSSTFLHRILRVRRQSVVGGGRGIAAAGTCSSVQSMALNERLPIQGCVKVGYALH